MNKLADILSGIWLFYYNGFKQMTWGRTLWLIIVLKLFVIFVVLRFCFSVRPCKDSAMMKKRKGRAAVATEMTVTRWRKSRLTG